MLALVFRHQQQMLRGSLRLDRGRRRRRRGWQACVEYVL